MVAEIRRARDAGDRETAVRLAHTLKGVAANLSIPEVAKIAAEAEAALREDREAALERLADTVGRVVSALAVLEPRTPSAPSENADPEALAAGLVRLRKLLETSDTEALSAVEKLEGLTGAADLAPLRARIEEFDFEGALEELTSRFGTG
jgi:HPt (histidine-containing phosphotransfer) domain-containing protein